MVTITTSTDAVKRNTSTAHARLTTALEHAQRLGMRSHRVHELGQTRERNEHWRPAPPPPAAEQVDEGPRAVEPGEEARHRRQATRATTMDTRSAAIASPSAKPSITPPLPAGGLQLDLPVALCCDLPGRLR